MPGSRITVARRLWLRGYLPALSLLVLWLFSTGTWMLWQGSSANKLRAGLARGVVMVNWNSTRRGYGVGTRTWALGTDLTVNGQRVTWYASRPIWSANRVWTTRQYLLELVPVLHSGHIKIPILDLALLAAVPPLIFARIRSRRALAGHCPNCGYDLSGNPNGPCPECGQSHEKSDSHSIRPPPE